MTRDKSTAPESGSDKDKSLSRPLDDLLAKRSKPFRDWKEEREYLRRKWGPQGKQIDLRETKGGDSSSKEE